MFNPAETSAFRLVSGEESKDAIERAENLKTMTTHRDMAALKKGVGDKNLIGGVGKDRDGDKRIMGRRGPRNHKNPKSAATP